MKLYRVFLMLGLVSSLFTAAIASTGTEASRNEGDSSSLNPSIAALNGANPEGVNNPNALGLAGVEGYGQGAPDNVSMKWVYCSSCPNHRRLAPAAIKQATAAPTATQRSSGAAESGDGQL